MIDIYRIRDSRRCRYYTCTKAQQMGRDSSEAKFVSEPAIKAALARRICRIGSDQRLVACVVGKAEEQWQTAIADLTLERDVARRKLANLGGESVKSPVNDQNQTVMGPVADLRERIQQMEARLTEIQEELCHLENQTLDRGDVRKAMEQFGPVWDSLLAREQARILRALIERVFYNGKVNRVTVTFRSAAIREMCQRTGEDGGLNPSLRPARTRKA
jgi:site-specific DNA recombinase